MGTSAKHTVLYIYIGIICYIYYRYTTIDQLCVRGVSACTSVCISVCVGCGCFPIGTIHHARRIATCWQSWKAVILENV